MFKKGQAALEFLTTYGWAFLVILVMIGALAYFGVLNPSKFVPDSCVFGSFICDDALLTANGNVTLKLRNSMESITITGINVTDLDSGTTFNTPGSILIVGVGDLSVDRVISAGKVFNLIVSSAFTFSEGEKKKVAIEIYYYTTSSGSGFGKTTGGDIVGTVQP